MSIVKSLQAGGAFIHLHEFCKVQVQTFASFLQETQRTWTRGTATSHNVPRSWPATASTGTVATSKTRKSHPAGERWMRGLRFEKKKRNKLSNWRLSIWSQVWARFCRVQVWVLGPGLVERREERNHNYLHHNWAGSPHPPHSIHLPVFKVSVIHVIKKMS